MRWRHWIAMAVAVALLAPSLTSAGNPRIENLLADLDQLREYRDELKEIRDQLRQDLEDYERILEYVSAQGGDLVIEGANLHVRNGLGGDTQNGLGNVVVGYNEGAALRDGSHNTVVGRGNSYGDKRGFVGGEGNLIDWVDVAILGGKDNDNTGEHSVIGGGLDNSANRTWSLVVGGANNDAENWATEIVGGQGNITLDRPGSGGTIGGGLNRIMDVDGGRPWMAGDLYDPNW